MNDMCNSYAHGEHIYLREPTEDDALGGWHEWFSDEDVTQYLIDRNFPNSKEQQLDFVKGLPQDRSRLVLSVVNKNENKHIGVVSLSGINWVHRYADIAVVIGDRDFRMSGCFALEAVSLMLKIAFLRLNLLNVKGGYVSTNERTSLLMKLFGFEEVGAFENLLQIGGVVQDLKLVQLSRDAWLSRNG